MVHPIRWVIVKTEYYNIVSHIIGVFREYEVRMQYIQIDLNDDTENLRNRRYEQSLCDT